MKKKVKRNFLLIAFIVTNVIFIFLQIYKQTYFVRLSYQKQRLEKERDEILQKKSLLTHQLYELKNPNSIKKFAIENLKMQKTKLNQIKKLSNE